MTIKKAVIPAAGFGTRMLPATKAIPKEMLPIVDKPSIQYIVEEAVSAGISEILIITSRTKTAMEDHFDYAPDVEAKLLRAGRAEDAAAVRAIADLADIRFLRQKEQNGLGDAVYCARSFVGTEPFAVLLGDDLMRSAVPVIGQLAQTAAQYNCNVVGVKEVDRESVKKYCTLDVSPVANKLFDVHEIIEKPTEEQIISHFSILGRYILTNEIFNILETQPPGHGGELQLTDGLGVLCKRQGMIAQDFDGMRYDCGNPAGYLTAFLDFAAGHPLTAETLRQYIAKASL